MIEVVLVLSFIWSNGIEERRFDLPELQRYSCEIHGQDARRQWIEWYDENPEDNKYLINVEYECIISDK